MSDEPKMYQAAHVYNATHDLKLYEWVAGLESQNQALQEENERLKAELAERSRIIDTLHLRSMSNTLQDADALQERIEEATALLKMEREWAGCFCFVEGGVDHAPDCTWAAWLERYERFLSPTQETDPE